MRKLEPNKLVVFQNNSCDTNTSSENQPRYEFSYFSDERVIYFEELNISGIIFAFQTE